MQEFLTEELKDFNYDVINEERNGKKVTILKGLFQRAGIVNGNKRVYPKEILREAIEENLNRIRSRQMLGELGHPRERNIHLDKVSHVVTDLRMDEEGKVIGSLEVFDGPDEEGGTPSGRILGSLIRRGVKIGVSSRASGELRKVGDINEVSKLNLITFDVVANPSTPDAYPEIQESLIDEEWTEKKTLDTLITEQL